MSSVIHYRFKAGSGEWSRIAFEGHALSLGELKRAVADQRKLNPTQQAAMAGAGAGTPGAAPGEAAGGRMLQDFELILSNHETGEEYHGDQTMIPKNSSVVVKRVPATRAKTLRIEAEAPDLLPFSPTTGPRQAPSSFDSPALKRQKLGASGGAVQAVDAVQELQRRAGLSLGMGLDRSGGGGGGGAADEFGDDPLDEFSYIQREEEKRQAEAKERQLRQQQEAAALQQQQLAAGVTAASVGVAAPPHPSHASAASQLLQGGPASAAAAAAPAPAVYVRPPPNRPPPPHYVCHNCNQKGHWKQSCPTAAHLSAPSASKLLEQKAQLASLIYAPRTNVVAAGSSNAVVAAAIQQAAARAQQMGMMAASQQPQQPLLQTGAAAEPAKPPVVTSPDLLCTLCTRLFTNPMVVPCCFTSFCDECIRQALVLESSRCPRCHSDAISADQLRPNKVMQRRVATEQQRIAEAQQGGGGGGGGGAGAAPAAAAAAAAALAPTPAQQQPSYSQPAHTAYSNGASSYQSAPAPAGGARKIATFGDD